MKKKKVRPKAEELTRRGAARMANDTQGRARILSPNKKVYNRKQKGAKLDD